MRIDQLGDGDPELAIVGAVHGDEPCGVHAIESLLDENPDVERPVKCIIANEHALEQNVRYTETDMNRVFPGDPDAEAYETRVAHELLDELRRCTTLSMHSTQSHDRPFAIVNETGPLAETICPQLSIDAIIEGTETFEHALAAHADVIEVECGRQGSEAATKNATRVVREFLSATGALPDAGTVQPPKQAIPVYQIQNLISKLTADAYAVLVENFEEVDQGEAFATVDGQDITAEEAFHPVLMSATGYKSQFGYAAELRSYLTRN